ncbi:Transcriptional regulator/sugar kinase [Gaiella occulta]|uniref:Transcriptional regulator/sugar kinase n=1 Tax=Gaiella occulta TaxID=1002870 RepID=A0A7M2YW24_9ACTN|nr:ROK family protein [Gaiella occulta]RDI73930.1 Transcriptional regulator/sugar kinase [Gaiella occulta]
MHEDHVIGVDLGGTKILAGLVGRDGSIGRTIEIPTPDGPQQEVLAAIDATVEDLLADGAAAIGYGVPLNIDRRTGIALRATNLPLHDVHFPNRARERYGLPAGVENDANAAALAEWRLGAGRGVSDLVMLTLGTGVGGGLVLDGRLYRGWAELGHIVVVADGEPCQGSCHGRGHLEAVASGLAADRAAAALYGPGAAAPELVRRAHAGEAAAIEALGRIGHLLGVAIGSLVNVFDPDVVVIGGGFGAAAGELVLGPAREAARREAIQPADETLRIVEARLGEDAGLIGAGLVGFEALDGER